MDGTAANLAYNLARLCDRDVSIAAVCRATGINRQQFNRYLAGQSIPNPGNRQKICRYFGISEAELFRPHGRTGNRRTADLRPHAMRRLPWSPHDAEPLLEALCSGSRPSLGPGTYATYFSQINERRSIVRSTTAIRNDDQLTTFRRITGLTEKKGSWWGQFLGDHRGVVLERAHWLYFLGLNVGGVLEPSMMVLRWLSGAYPMLGGYACINATAGPSPVAVVMVPDEASLRDALRAAHAYSVDDPGLNPFVLEALEEQAALLASKTTRP